MFAPKGPLISLHGPATFGTFSLTNWNLFLAVDWLCGYFTGAPQKKSGGSCVKFIISKTLFP